MSQETQPPSHEAIDSEATAADQRVPPASNAGSNRTLLIIIGIGCAVVLGICVLLGILGFIGWFSVTEMISEDEVTSLAPGLAAMVAL